MRALLFKMPGKRQKITKRVNKEGLQSLLTTEVQRAAEKVPVRKFLKAMKQERKTTFHRDDLPPLTNQNQISSVCLQMISGGLMALKVKEVTKVGTDKLNGGHLCVVCPNTKYTKDGNTLCAPAYMRDECWNRFNLN